MRRMAAYSLYELVMTVALAAALTTLGIPSFGNLVANQRIRAEVDGLFHAIHRARQESVVRRRAMSICPSADGTACNDGNAWTGGWMLFVNIDRDWPAVRDTDEPVVKWTPIDPRVTIRSNRSAYTLRATELRATNGTLVFCDAAGRGTPRALVVSYTGRPRVAYEDNRGRPYRCPD